MHDISPHWSGPLQNTSATCFPPAHGHYWPVVTLAQDRNIQTGLAGSFVIHALALLLLLWGFSTEAGKHLLPPPVVKEEPVQEVTMIFPEQLIPAPLLPKEPPPKAYIRTTQNEGVAAAPKNAVFQSDRNTVAASKLPPKSDATLMMPTLNGNAPTTLELANRDYRDGQIKNDNAPLANATPLEMRQPQPPAPPSVLKPQTQPQPQAQAQAQPTAPPSILKPQPQAQPPAPPVPPAPTKQVAKATPADSTPLLKMMEEMDKEAARMDQNKLPIEVRKAEASKTEASKTEASKVADAPPPKPQVREPQDTPPPAPKAIPVAEPVNDPVKVTAGIPEKDAFNPFTRMSKVDGAISREGENAVDAEATPLGKYMRQVTGAVEKKWHLYVKLGKDSINYGRVRFRFYVDRRGTPQDLKILSDARDADPRMRELTLRAILDAKIPPIPDDLLPTLFDERVKIEYEAIVY